MYLIDPEGTIIRLDLRGKALEETLSRLIKRPAQTAREKPRARATRSDNSQAPHTTQMQLSLPSNTKLTLSTGISCGVARFGAVSDSARARKSLCTAGVRRSAGC